MVKTCILVLAATIVFAVSSAASAAPGDPAGDERARAAQARSYWTPERIQNAKPRDMVLPGEPVASGRPVGERGKPGGGGGGGAGTGIVTGKSWTASGLVKSATGKVFFHMDGGDWTCSGTVVEDSTAGRSLVLTAAHCVYDEFSDEFASYWIFIPDYDNGGSSGWYFDSDSCPAGKCWVASNLVTTQQWADNGSKKWEEDYAFAVIKNDVNGGSLEDQAGALPLDFNNSYSETTWIDAFGYPAAKKYSGADLVYCAGPDHVIADGLTQTTSIQCGMTGGSSGGAWLEGFDASDQDPVGAVRSVTSYSYSSTNGYLFGPIFDSYTSKTHQAAKTANGNQLVSAP